MKLTLIYNHFTSRYYYGEILEDKNTYWKIRVLRSSTLRLLAEKVPYTEAQYPNGIRVFFKEFCEIV